MSTAETSTDYETITVSPLNGACGAEVAGVDLSSEVAPQTVAEIIKALDVHSVVRFRGQELSPQAQERFATRFGQLAVYPFAEPTAESQHVFPIIKTAEQTENFGGAWHSDSAYLDTPPSYTMLYGVKTPEVGGHTLFTSQRLVTADMTSGFLDELSGMRVVYRAGNVPRYDRLDRDGMHHQSNPEVAEHEVDHPLVRVHPNTGERFLYLSRVHTRRFKGMTEEESRPLLDQLFSMQIRAEYASWMDWEDGQLTIWDNRIVLHYALNNYQNELRHMHRTTVLGEVPLAG